MPVKCDCELSHNGFGMALRECDCEERKAALLAQEASGVDVNLPQVANGMVGGLKVTAAPLSGGENLTHGPRE